MWIYIWIEQNVHDENSMFYALLEPILGKYWSNGCSIQSDAEQITSFAFDNQNYHDNHGTLWTIRTSDQIIRYSTIFKLNAIQTLLR